MAMVAALLFFSAALCTAGGGNAAAVEHTFVVSQVRMRRSCNDTAMTVVNGQLPGPVIEVTEGDSVVVHVVNKSPHGITIHWHRVKQRLNCWNDGVGMITQCPIQPGSNFTYRFNVAGQEGTLWWHAHVSCLRGSVHGALVIRPREGPSAYPFPKPDKEIPIVIGEWWDIDLVQYDRDMSTGNLDANPAAATINGKMGDLYSCSGAVEDSYILNVEYGRTYLLRILNAALFSEYYLKIAGHKFTVVAVDANYVKPYTTDIIVIAPGETVDALVVADAPPERYGMVALAIQPPKPDPQIPKYITRGVVQYNPSSAEAAARATPVAPEMPDQHDTLTSFYFHGNLTSLLPRQRPLLPVHVDEHMFVTLALGSICRSTGSSSCNRTVAANESIVVATMNNVSFELPTTMPLLKAHYHGEMSSVPTLRDLPTRPSVQFNFTDRALIPFGVKEEHLAPTSKATVARRFRFNSTVEIVFQSTSLMESESNPMHLHGHDFFVLAQGQGNYDIERDVERYNLVDPPVRNTVLVPRLGWTAIRFVTDNPGVWLMHCHFDFHISMGMAAAFEVDDGPTSDTTLPPPPKCDQHKDNDVAYE